MTAFASTRAVALAALEDFLDRAPAYSAMRNLVEPGHPHVSRLSPAIRSRVVLEEECIEAVLRRHRFAQVEKWIQEVLWRTYWKGWLELRPTVWASYTEALRRIRAEAPAHTLARAGEVAAGRGGIAVMDRFARELAETAYLHNHARMWWASYWIHVERLPWELGADFFLRHLLDGDAASNTLGWRWVAGLQTPGKTYLVRRSNIEKFCHPDYLDDATGLEILDDSRVAAAPLPREVPAPACELPLFSLPPDLPACGLLLHDEDSCPESGPIAHVRMKAAFRLPPSSDAQPVVAGYRRAALADAAHRASLHFGCDVTGADPAAPTGSLAAWAANNRLQHVVCYTPAAGPLRDAFPRIEAALAEAGVTLLLARRDRDAGLFPLAQKGFFDFWERTQQRLHLRGRDRHL